MHLRLSLGVLVIEVASIAGSMGNRLRSPEVTIYRKRHQYDILQKELTQTQHLSLSCSERIDRLVQGLHESPAQYIFEPMRVEKSTLTVFTPLDDGTGVLLNLTTLFYYSLNRTAVALWQELERRNPSTLDDLVRATCRRFDVDETAARQHIAAFVGQLEELRMVRVL